MLNNEIIKKIEDFVYSKPRSIQEIAMHVGKNWRTADRYVSEIEKSYGTLATRIFRGGTRGALKIVFWSSVEKINSSIFQEILESDILSAKRKEDFSAFDIFQHVSEKNKQVKVKTEKSEEIAGFLNVKNILEKAENKLLIFSGNLSFINLTQKNERIIDIIDKLLKKGITIKILCRVDILGKKNIENILELNYKYGKELIEIRHREHPLRATIVDNTFFVIKEIKEPTGKINELDKKIFIFYNIKDKDWVEWLSRIFWKIFSSSVSAKKRLFELEKLKQ
ncbi:hypothetical protein HYW75_00855 [Candidatus Pacearchaeota archaeon]|nr:hypothetical protein [Candidatus Pacearchaeota archaeon]